MSSGYESHYGYVHATGIPGLLLVCFRTITSRILGPSLKRVSDTRMARRYIFGYQCVYSMLRMSDMKEEY